MDFSLFGDSGWDVANDLLVHVNQARVLFLCFLKEIKKKSQLLPLSSLSLRLIDLFEEQSTLYGFTWQDLSTFATFKSEGSQFAPVCLVARELPVIWSLQSQGLPWRLSLNLGGRNSSVRLPSEVQPLGNMQEATLAGDV